MPGLASMLITIVDAAGQAQAWRSNVELDRSFQWFIVLFLSAISVTALPVHPSLSNLLRSLSLVLIFCAGVQVDPVVLAGGSSLEMDTCYQYCAFNLPFNVCYQGIHWWILGSVNLDVVREISTRSLPKAMPLKLTLRWTWDKEVSQSHQRISSMHWCWTNLANSTSTEYGANHSTLKLLFPSWLRRRTLSREVVLRDIWKVYLIPSPFKTK